MNSAHSETDLFLKMICVSDSVISKVRIFKELVFAANFQAGRQKVFKISECFRRFNLMRAVNQSF